VKGKDMNDVPWGKCDFWGYSKRRIMATSSPQSILRRFPTTSAVQAFFMTCASLPALRGAPASSPAETNNGTMAVMEVHPQKRNERVGRHKNDGWVQVVVCYSRHIPP